MKRISNNEFRRKSLPQRTQYLKDGDDDHANSFRTLNAKLKVIIGFLSAIFVMVAGYIFDLVFIH